jgi:hypothetical protein
MHSAVIGSCFKEEGIHQQIITMLIEAKADVNAQMQSILGPDEHDYWRDEACNMALKAGSDVKLEDLDWEALEKRFQDVNNVADVEGRQANAFSSQSHECNVILKSILRDIVSRCDRNSGKLFAGKISIIHFAILANKEDLFSFLIEAKADPNSSASIRVTRPFNIEVQMCSALNASVMLERNDFVKMLLEARADPNANLTVQLGGSGGFSVHNLLFANQNGNTHVAELLTKAHANADSDSFFRCQPEDPVKLYDFLAQVSCIPLVVGNLFSLEALFDDKPDGCKSAFVDMLECLDLEGQKKIVMLIRNFFKDVGVSIRNPFL